MRRERTTRLSRYTWARMRRKVDDGQEGREEFRRQRSGERNGNGRGEEKLVTLLQDFCSRRCHCQEIERWRGREEGRARGASLREQASTSSLTLLSCGGEFSLAAQTFLRPALPQQENCLLKFNLENSSAPLSRPREDHGGMRSQTMDVHAPPCLHSSLKSGDLASTERRVTENNGYFARL